MASSDLTVDEAAAEIRRHRGTVENWIRAGVVVAGRRVKLAAVRVGGRYTVPRAALAAFVAACNPDTAAPVETPGEAATRARRAVEAARRALAGGRP
ncbi:MAG: helix-turn-helix domain-containing protein [Chloroflexota bacterium]